MAEALMDQAAAATTSPSRAMHKRSGRPAAAAVSTVNFAAGSRNIRMMRVLERVAKRFNEAGVPIMALKGAALNLTLYERADERPMTDLDLMIQPQHAEQACALLEEIGCLRCDTPIREDFFPRYHYETAYSSGQIFPVRIDLHVRPFRPLRYARLVPANAFWERALTMRIGRARVLIPSLEEMLIHLAVHSAVHGNSRKMWLCDIKRWVDAVGQEIDWEQFLESVRSWRLALPTRQAIARVEDEFGGVCPPKIRQTLFELPVHWCDRLALAQAPRDVGSPAAHLAVTLLCTPGLRFTIGYLLAVAVPDRGHMGEWYIRRHAGWLLCAHLLRWLGPIAKRVPRFWTWLSKIETGKSAVHGIGVMARRNIRPGELIARYRGRKVDRDGPYVMTHESPSGQAQRYELTGKLRFLNHRCRPNAELCGFELIALTHIRPGQEVRVDYGEGACNCGNKLDPSDSRSAADGLAEVA